MSFLSHCAQRVILFYQDNISALKPGPTCRFEPSCSRYALLALRQHGFFRGSLLAMGRLLRCAPWHPGGWDPIPRRFLFSTSGVGSALTVGLEAVGDERIKGSTRENKETEELEGA